MTIEASQDFVNKFVERQQRAISDLMNKVILLETQLAVAQDRLVALEAASKNDNDTDDNTFKSSEIKEQ